jgi:peptidylprolyl isomerase
MKTLTLSLTLLAFSAAPLLAQTAPTSHPPAHPTPATHAAPAAPACVKEPELSPKIPALPADASCAKHLYSITTIPSVKIENVSPMETKTLAEKLGIESSTFSLDYIDTKIGDGALAAPDKFYSIHYTGYLLDGTKFDSSLDHPNAEPIVIKYGGHQVIPGWDTGFDGMHVGGKRRLFIPFQLAYGAQGKPPVIPERAELIFDVELVAQSDEKPAPKPAPAPAPAPASQPAAAPATTPAAPATTPATTPAKPATTPPATAPKQ